MPCRASRGDVVPLTPPCGASSYLSSAAARPASGEATSPRCSALRRPHDLCRRRLRGGSHPQLSATRSPEVESYRPHAIHELDRSPRGAASAARPILDTDPSGPTTRSGEQPDVRHVPRVGTRPATTPRTRRSAEHARPGRRLTCETTAASAPTTTSVRRMTDTDSAPTAAQLAVIPGDGIGPEVTAEALKVLEVAAPAGVKFEPTRYDLGAERYLATGEVLPDSVLAEIRGARRDPARRGRRQARRPEPAAGHPRARPAAAAALRARPLRQPAAVPDLPGRRVARCADPGEVDFVVVREGTEGPYTGNGGALRVGTPHEVATEVSRQHGVRRRARRPRRVRPGPAPAAQEAHPGPQDQRAGARRRGVVADRRRGRRGVPRRRRSTTCTSTRPRSS